MRQPVILSTIARVLFIVLFIIALQGCKEKHVIDNNDMLKEYLNVQQEMARKGQKVIIVHFTVAGRIPTSGTEIMINDVYIHPGPFGTSNIYPVKSGGLYWPFWTAFALVNGDSISSGSIQTKSRKYKFVIDPSQSDSNVWYVDLYHPYGKTIIETTTTPIGFI